MSSNSGMAPRVSTGVGKIFQSTPSRLVARYNAGVLHVASTLLLNNAQYSPRSSIHCMSTCHGKNPLLARFVASGGDQCSPSTDRRSSTVVVVAVHPRLPLTDSISHSFALRRTTVGEISSWLNARATSTREDQLMPSSDRRIHTTFSPVTSR